MKKEDLAAIWPVLDETRRTVVDALDGSPRQDVANLLLLRGVQSLQAAVLILGDHIFEGAALNAEQRARADEFYRQTQEAGLDLLIAAFASRGRVDSGEG